MNSVQQNRILYLRWLATKHADLYKATVVPIVKNFVMKKTMAGLGDALNPDASDIYGSFGSGTGTDTSSIFTPSSPDLSNSVLSTPTPSSSDNSSGGLFSSLSNNSGSIFSSIVSAVPTLANTYVGTQSQLNLLSINTQRAQQGLPPLVNTNGTLVTANQLAAPNSATAAVEHAITTGMNLPLMLGLAGAGLVLVLIASSRKSK